MFKKKSKRAGFCRKARAYLSRLQITKGVLPNRSFEQILEDLRISKRPNTFEMFGFLSMRHFRSGQLIKDYGLVSCNLVTVAFANYIVDSLQNSTTSPLDAFKYHAVGTGTTAEANTQTALVTEIESRVAGTQIEGATANIFKTVATITFTGTHTVAEFGLFSASSGGTMLDRGLLVPTDDVVNLDEIEYTYQLTVNAET